LYKGVLAAAALCIAPAALPASARANQPGVRARASSNEAFTNDASKLLQQIQADALRVKDRADQLEMLVAEPFNVDWQMDGRQLERIRDRVNEMDRLVYRLRANQSEALPWQQKATDRIAATVVNLTGTTQAAIISLNNNQGRIAFSNLEGLAGDIYTQGGLINRAVANFEQYANARHEVRQIKQAPGLKGNS
jgi:hypothetical protein